MKVHALGHSSYLLDMPVAPGSGESDDSIRILADPWISDFLIGDLMGRFPRIRLDYEKLGRIDAIFLSHSHTDHLCPYSLIELWKNLEPKPALLLPESLTYLSDLFREHLDSVEITLLHDEQEIDFCGASIHAFFNPEVRPTNEDDVMVLVVRGDGEVFLGESDAVLPLDDPGVREYVCAKFHGARSSCFWTVKNQGEATLSMLAARDAEDRAERWANCTDSMGQEIEDAFTEYPQLEGELWQLPGLVRLIGGQGISFPQCLDTDWNRVLFPIRLVDRVLAERDAIERYGYSTHVEEFAPGRVYTIENGALAGNAEDEAIELLDAESDRDYDPTIPLYDDWFPTAPLRDEERDRDQQRALTLEALNHRFLPWWIGTRNPPLEHLLAQNGGKYTVRVRFGTTSDHEDRDYVHGFATRRCEETTTTDEEPDEFYWANDLDDLLRGEADEFSLASRRPLGGVALRVWQALGLPYLNNDLIEAKLRFHFERAARGEPLADWVLSYYRAVEE